MPDENIVASQINIKVDGADIQKDIMNQVLEVVVDQNTHLPGMFMIRIYDPKMKLIDGSLFDLTKEIEILALTQDGNSHTLIKGEITALEPGFRPGMNPELQVRGYDKSHRLYRELKSRSFLNVKDSDLASQIAGGAGLSTQVDATSTVYDHIYQHNLSDLAFLMQRAWRIGYECFVEDGKLFFRKPVNSGSQVSLTFGQDLLEFYPVASLAEQVDEVQVKGWDVEKVEPIVGQAKKGKLYAEANTGKDGAGWAGAFGTGKKVIVDQPVVSQAEADTLAAARLDEISGAFIEAHGRAIRRPDVKAGIRVELKGLGKRFSGKYMVTSATHTFNPDGLMTTFAVRGSRSGLLAEQMDHQPPVDKWAGVVPAIVTNTDDPSDIGRVKVKYPWMTNEAESFWARVVNPGAGPEAGFFCIPDVGDEVIVAFEQGDFNQPYVLGGVWNGKNKITATGASGSSGERPLVRSWTSRTGHEIGMFDNSENKIEIKTAGGHSILLDDQNKKIEIKSNGGHKVVMDDQGKKLEIATSTGQKMTMDDNAKSTKVTGSTTLEISSSASLKLKAATIDIEASGPVNVKGAVVNLG